MNYSLKLKIALWTVIGLWASAFVGIRAGLQDYSPGGLALFRYLIASGVMLLIYFSRQDRKVIYGKDLVMVIMTGVIGIGVYNITLNYGEIKVPSGIASFIVSQSPIITTLFAILFLQERINLYGLIGIGISVFGVLLIALSRGNEFKFYACIIYILLATLSCGLYSILQKLLLKKYHVIDLTAYAIWSGTCVLLIFIPDLKNDLQTVSLASAWVVIYLGIFPAALAYLAWNYILNRMSATHAVSYLYATPLVTTLIGWLWLAEIPRVLAMIGGLTALLGVWLVNQSYKFNTFQEESYGKIN